MKKNELSDKFLMDAIIEGATWALERLHERYSRRFYWLAYRMTTDHMASEELVQDAFFAVWQSAASYAPQAGTVRAWLFSIIYHQTLNHLRVMHRSPALLQVPWQEVEEYERFALADVWEQVWGSVQSAELHASLQHLPKEQQAVIELAYFGGLTHGEIAQHCQIPLGTVKARLRLGVLHLKRALGQRGRDERRPCVKRTNDQVCARRATTTVVQAPESSCATGYELSQNGPCRCFGYTEWEHLVEQLEEFEFNGAAGSFIARKERRSHGRTYWYAYTWGSSGRRKSYLGRSAELTLARFEAMARKLHEGEQGD